MFLLDVIYEAPYKNAVMTEPAISYVAIGAAVALIVAILIFVWKKI